MSTKQELQAENERLGKEVAALRELLAAISAAAGTVPIAKDDDGAEWRRSVRVLANISGLAKVDDSWDGYLAYAAGELRSIAAEPVGYEVYVSFKDGDEEAQRAAAPVITDSERDCDERNPDGSGEPCHRGGDHDWHRDSNGDEWRADPGGVMFGPFDAPSPVVRAVAQPASVTRVVTQAAGQ